MKITKQIHSLTYTYLLCEINIEMQRTIFYNQCNKNKFYRVQKISKQTWHSKMDNINKKEIRFMHSKFSKQFLLTHCWKCTKILLWKYAYIYSIADINQKNSKLINVLCTPDTFSNSSNCVNSAYEKYACILILSRLIQCTYGL